MKRFRPSESTTAIPKVKETLPPKTTQKLDKPKIKDVITIEKEVTTSQSIDSSFGFGNKMVKVHNVITMKMISASICHSFRSV